MNVERLMVRAVKTCQPQDSLNTAAKLMWDSSCGSVGVVANGQVVGILTDRDICMAAYTQGRCLKDMQVSSAMSKKLFSCRPEDSIATAEKIMQDNGIRRLPVATEDGRLVGILSLDDIAREAAREGKGKGRAEITAEELCNTFAAICERSTHGTAMTA